MEGKQNPTGANLGSVEDPNKQKGNPAEEGMEGQVSSKVEAPKKPYEDYQAKLREEANKNKHLQSKLDTIISEKNKEIESLKAQLSEAGDDETAKLRIENELLKKQFELSEFEKDVLVEKGRPDQVSEVLANAGIENLEDSNTYKLISDAVQGVDPDQRKTILDFSQSLFEAFNKDLKGGKKETPAEEKKEPVDLTGQNQGPSRGDEKQVSIGPGSILGNNDPESKKANKEGFAELIKSLASKQ